MKTAELFANAYSNTQEAGDVASRLFVKLEKSPLTHDDVREWRGLMQAGLCALTALEERVKGNPEPKRGD